MPATSSAAPATLITSRPLDEYCGLFGLNRSDLRAMPGPVLDCPGGASGLVAEARELGCLVIATDPLYAAPPAERTALARAGRDTMSAAITADRARYLPAEQVHPEKYLRSWDRARRLFAADSSAHPERYIAAELPRLPFDDHTFVLSLSSYLLFAYPELFSPADQLSALLELVRVTDPAGEVRVYPLHDGEGRRCPHLNDLRAALGRHHVSTKIIPVAAPGRPRHVLVLRSVPRRRRSQRSRRTCRTPGSSL